MKEILVSFTVAALGLTLLTSCNMLKKQKEKVMAIISNQKGATQQDVREVDMPSIQRIGIMFDDMEKGKDYLQSTYGITLTDEQSRMEDSDYEEADGSTAQYKLIKQVYSTRWKVNATVEDVLLAYVNAIDYGEPRMTIKCGSKSWEALKAEAQSSLKLFGDDSYFLNNYSFVRFPKSGIIEITCEMSVSWNGMLFESVNGTTPDKPQTDPFVGKVYRGSGNGGGLYTEMTITFLQGNRCECHSDWYQAYSEGKTFTGTYEVTDKLLKIRCVGDGGTEYTFDFDIRNNGRQLSFDHSDPDAGGTIGNDYMSLNEE